MTATKSKPYIYEGGGSAIEDYNKPKTHNPQPTTAKNWAAFDKSNRQHMGVMGQLRTLQWTVPHPRHGEVADLARLSDFLKSDKSPVKKPLKDMEPKELSKIIECLKSMVVKKYK
ncbi:hypothetical protein GCM10008015_26620 [Flavobacterium palustre]|uniref:Uncharacterized protein n=1 Tax=Flavobacterium palustre TaxID=1476463 RepID=A0ABQ1HNW2_9FLAO|nr:hypothetical protein [Flavobacterium palustre]GGA84504.1 hypothetical protein GCM10008015_26620 [Flavobacterium palustre]